MTLSRPDSVMDAVPTSTARNRRRMLVLLATPAVVSMACVITWGVQLLPLVVVCEAMRIQGPAVPLEEASTKRPSTPSVSTVR